MNRIISILAGFGGAVVLFLFYFLFLAYLSGSWRHPIDDFLALKYWLSALLIGFGIQVGLFHHLRRVIHLKGKGGKVAAANTGTSTVAMIACCAHHLADLLPFIGLTGAALFLAEYKKYFIAIGIISNIIGVFFTLRVIKKCHI